MMYVLNLKRERERREGGESFKEINMLRLNPFEHAHIIATMMTLHLLLCLGNNKC